MGRNYRFRDQAKLYFITFGVVNWIDALTRPLYKMIIIDSIKYCIINKGLEVYTWCIMSNHVHMIIGTTDMKMEDIVRDLKRHTSKSILKAIEENPYESRKKWMLRMFEWAGKNNSNNKKYQFWQQHNHPIELFNNHVMDQKLEYIHMNPVRAEIVFKPEDYVYSSAIDYAGGKGLIPVLFIG
ncbi:MAG: REP-associated tyrosine transposase [Candidatus Cyclobacteriaceae bacterium M2_1C_046]